MSAPREASDGNVRQPPIAALIVEDEPLIRWSVAETLRGLGCDVEESGDAASALELVAREPERFDLVVLDYHLPDAHDLNLLAHVRRLCPRAHVILMTAYMAPEEAARALALGARQLLHKPVELETFAALVQGVRPSRTPAV